MGCRSEEKGTNSYSCCIHEHQHTYAPTRNQKGNQSRGAWRPTNTTGRHQAREPIPWKHQHDVEYGGKTIVGHYVRFPLGWMDGWSYLVPAGYNS